MQSLSHHVLSAMLNGGYQGLLLAVVVWASLKLLPRTNAATRHAVLFVTLLVVAALPLAHLLVKESHAITAFDSGGSQSEGASSLSSGHDELVAPTTIMPGESMGSDAAQGGKSGNSSTDQAIELLPVEIFTDLLWESPIVSGGPMLGAEPSVTILPEPFEVGSNPAAESSTVNPPEITRFNVLLPSLVSVLFVSVWLAIGLMRLGHLIWQSYQLRVLKQRAAHAPDRFHALFSTLSAEMGLARRARLVMGPEFTAPMAVGYRSPAVIIPKSTFAGADELQVQQLLRHELAHLVRRDDWANLVQQTICALLFFHPAVWWLSRRLTLEREIACDDHVLAATRDARRYALFLTEFAGRMRCRDMVAAPAAWNKKKQLKERIAMILDSNRNSSPRLATARLGIVTTITALIAVVALQAAPRLTLAAESQAGAPATDRPINSEDKESIEISAVTESQSDSQIQTDFVSTTVIADPTSEPRPKSSPRPAVAVTGIVRSVAVAPSVAANVAVSPVVAVQPVAPKVASISTSGGLTITALSKDEESSGNRSSSSSTSSPRRVNQGQSNENIDKRIDRLERLVEELLAREKGPREAKSLTIKGADFSSEKLAKMTEELGKMAEKSAKAGLDEASVARIHEQAKRDAERVVRDVERAVKEAQRAGATAGGKGAMANGQSNLERNQLESQRKALESQRKSLEKEIQTIEKRLDQLHDAQDRLKEKLERDHQEKHLDREPNTPKDGGSEEPSGPKKKF